MVSMAGRQVALAYQEQTREDDPCNTDVLKRHWVKNLCQNMKKPTGRPGENNWYLKGPKYLIKYDLLNLVGDCIYLSLNGIFHI